MASGQGKSQDGTARLTLVRIVPKGRLCAKQPVASVVEISDEACRWKMDKDELG